jgi:hypothetical protein
MELLLKPLLFSSGNIEEFITIDFQASLSLIVLVRVKVTYELAYIFHRKNHTYFFFGVLVFYSITFFRKIWRSSFWCLSNNTLFLLVFKLSLLGLIQTRYFDAQYCDKKIILSHRFLLAKVSS